MRSTHYWCWLHYCFAHFAAGVQLPKERMFEAMREAVARHTRLHPLSPGAPQSDSSIVAAVLPTQGLLVSRKEVCKKCALIIDLLDSVVNALRSGMCNEDATARGLKIVPLQSASFYIAAGSIGCGQEERSYCSDYPTLVIGKSPAQQANNGIMHPNPYIAASIISYMARERDMQRTVAALPLSAREARVVWRGSLYGKSGTFFVPADIRARFMRTSGVNWLSDAECHAVVAQNIPPGVGRVARLMGVSLSCLEPRIFDVRATGECSSTRREDLRLAMDCWLRIRQNVSRLQIMTSRKTCNGIVCDDHGLRPGEFGKYAAQLVLPGKMEGGYSRHVNHLWLMGSPIMIWNSVAAEARSARQARHRNAALDSATMNGLSPSSMSSLRDEPRQASGFNASNSLVSARAGEFVSAREPDRSASSHERIFAEDTPLSQWMNLSLPMFAEWYHPALLPGITHLDVASHTVERIA